MWVICCILMLKSGFYGNFKGLTSAVYCHVAANSRSSEWFISLGKGLRYQLYRRLDWAQIRFGRLVNGIKIGLYREMNWNIQTRSLLTTRFVMMGYFQPIINLQFESRARSDIKIRCGWRLIVSFVTKHTTLPYRIAW